MMIDPNTSKIRIDVDAIKGSGFTSADSLIHAGLKKVQRGLLTIASGISTGNATISTAVDMDKTSLSFSLYHALVGATQALKNDLASGIVRGRITTTTNIHFQRGMTIGDIYIAWEVIEWK